MTTSRNIKRIIPAVLLIGGLVGFAASSVLTIEKIRVLERPEYSPACSINPILNCVTVTDTSQGQIFGIPHSLIGIAAFAGVITVGAIMLMKGTVHERFWRLFTIGTLAGFIAIHYFIFQSLYRLNALCIYCMITWSVVAPIFWYASLFGLEQDFIRLPRRFHKIRTFALSNHGKLLAVWYVVILLLILERFWDYWITLV